MAREKFLQIQVQHLLDLDLLRLAIGMDGIEEVIRQHKALFVGG
jgi:hypothetical protein